MKTLGSLTSWVAMAVALGTSGTGLAGNTASVVHYTLLPASQFSDDSLMLGRPTILLDLRGGFDLRLIAENPLFATYAVDGLSFQAGTPGVGSPYYQMTGHGTYEIGGEVALRQTLFLELQIDDGQTNKLCRFTNSTSDVNRLWPMIQVSADQTNGSPAQIFRLDFEAAPLRELWFSTTHSLTAGIWDWPTNHVSAGDLLSSTGRIVKRNNELTSHLGIMPMVPDLGLDAVDVLPGGEIAFSITDDEFSESLGPLHHGDVLSSRGRVITNYMAILAPFMPMPPIEDMGLDALHFMPDGELYFSVANDFFSERFGRTIRRGDVLSSQGAVIKANEDLVARFSPADTKKDYGLDALYVWPSGEIWFSVETGFYGQHFEPYNAGDLLSDQGYVVYRNLNLVGSFQPLEDLADFGLDALFVITDLAETPAAIPALRLDPLYVNRQTGDVTLSWQGAGRVFQIEKATNVVGPWLPLSPTLTDSSVIDWGAAQKAPQGHYRVRQW